MARRLKIRCTDFRECPNCNGRGDDGASWRPLECRRCRGRGRLITGVEILDLDRGLLPDSAFDFNAQGEVFLLDAGEDEDIEVVREEF